ncbi:Hint domain-containing protein [Paracoccus sp. Z330]|uniref:Hint domain-containing protein n=1 Tax=Paracoccus onchidii TaxID=3017813 RepID=A0ABT4ZKF7_9RHOB|nr:Hint domain-containing protein [Paracoccus onchidii]MDB6179704.1 Hint domain-containing protein [Paracoccus onchidii]
MPTTWNAIYLGQSSSLIDPTEGNQTAENAADLLGTYGSASTPLSQNIVRGETIDFYGDNGSVTSTNGVLNQDNFPYVGSNELHDDFNVALPGQSESALEFDATSQYAAEIQYADGSTAVALLDVFQTVDGHIFVAPSLDPATNTLLTAQAIDSIELLNVFSPVSDGLAVDRPDLTFPCFAAGTMIATKGGAVAVETLQAGDLVQTVDDGLQPLRWVGRAEIDLDGAPQMRPVRIRANALGAGIPSCDLLVSPQHRILVKSRIAQRMFGSDEVLVAAKQLLALEGVEQASDLRRVTYVHFLFDRHQLVWSNGAQTESLFTGPEALRSVGVAARDEIFALFPELDQDAREPVRALAPGRRARRLAQRHGANGHCAIQQQVFAPQ